MKPGKLTVVVGLPGAGKSTRVKKIRCSVTGLCIEDFHANARRDSSSVKDSIHYQALIEALRAGHDCVVADIAFCEELRRNNLIEAVAREIAGVLVEPIFFENDPDKCRRNIQRRARPSLIRDLEELGRLASVYCIPDGVTPRPVYEDENSDPN